MSFKGELADGEKELASYKMSRIRAKGTEIERIMSRALWRRGLRGYRKNVRGILGTPDFCWRASKVAVFCDSSFWHGYNWSEQINTIKTRKEFWTKKIEDNIKRDRKINLELRREGWKVLRFWDFQIRNELDLCIREIKKNIALTRIG